MKWTSSWLPVVSFLLFSLSTMVVIAAPAARAAENPNCPITPIKASEGEANIFNPAQEMELGDVLARVVESQTTEIDEPELTAYLQQLGDRLVRNLPASGLKYRFYLSNDAVANAYSIAGGRVYVTRKLVSYARSEDELAGVLAHELGHIATHQSAIEYTKLFKRLGINGVTDEKDIEAKFHQMLESGKTLVTSEDEKQVVADRVGLEVTALEGYNTGALADFLDRLTNNKGKTGNWFSNLFGTTPESAVRLREMQRTMKTFPAECVQHRTGDADAFRAWQSKVVEYSGSGRRENIPGLAEKKALDPPLQDEVHTLRFSYDGRYVLAQDDGNIYVLTREPFGVKFRINAPDAYPAKFTEDSKRLTFYDSSLHVELWDPESGKRTGVREVVSALGCLQTALSADGASLACVDDEDTLVLFDTASDERVWEKKHIRHGDLGVDAGLSGYRVRYQVNFMNMEFSPDGSYLLLASGNDVIAVDVKGHKEIPVEGALKPYLQGAFTFIAADRIVGNMKNGTKAGVFSFPEGDLKQDIELGSSAPFRVAKGDFVLMRPIQDHAVGVLELSSNKIVRASKTPGLDIYGDLAVNMLGTGEVGLFGASSTPIARAALPRGHLGGKRVVEYSDDLNWLAVSTRSRGGVWDLASGARKYSLKSFRGACFPKDGNVYLDFPKKDKADRALVKASLQQPGMTLVAKVDSEKAWQDCEYFMTLNPNGDSKDKQKKDAQGGADDADKRDFRFEGKRMSWKEVFEMPALNETLEVRDVRTNAVLWSRTFAKAVPAIYTDAQLQYAIFKWRLDAEGAKAEAKGLPNDFRPQGPLKDTDYLVEIVDLSTGHMQHALVIGTADGVFKVHRVMANRDWLVAADSLDRTLVYSLKDGKCVSKGFGYPRNMSLNGTVIIQKASGRLAWFQAGQNDEHEATFSYPLLNTYFTNDSKRVSFLTRDQTLYNVKLGSE